MRFRNPTNGYETRGGGAASILWAFLFGPLYFIARGVWSHAVISLVLAVITVGASWLVYPWFAPMLINRHFLRAGWIRVR